LRRAGSTLAVMRTIAYGVLAALALTVPACTSKANRQELQPLPGVTTLAPVTTVPGATTVPGVAIGTTIPGATVPATAAPATTIAPVTAPPATTVPPATAPPGPGWPFGDFRDVPQLDSESVQGSGCGAAVSLGETIPDGWWLGIVIDSTATTYQYDLVCAYHGAEAASLITECQASPAAATCLDYFDQDFWPMNRNSRTRTVPLSADLEVGSNGELCAVGTETRAGGITGGLNWLHIVGGKAVYLRQGCG